MALDLKNARVRPVHVDDEPAAQHRKITSESGTYRMSDRTARRLARAAW